MLVVLGIGSCCPALADGARFDLTGPKIDIRVTRAGMSLPIASVPNLAVGDKLWVHPDLPASQSVRYLLVVAFLRGTTNPPPDNWFLRIETWDKKIREEGTEITVPEGAQQAVIFLAPATGGDFGALKAAVQGRPGVFVRASHDLDLAGFEQARIEKYIASMREVPQAELSDPKALAEHSNVIAGTLALKPNADCTKLPPDQQYTCLTQSGSQTLLDDSHGQSIVAALSNGPGSDFINQASYTQLAGAGQYSAYVGTVVDLVRIMGSLHTAHYQYIPAIAFPNQEELNLRLNTPPSFQNPKSVIVIGLPAVQQTSAPPLRPRDPKLVSCMLKPELILPVEGAPLVFSTGFAHDMVLHINYPEGTAGSSKLRQDLPLVADPYKGGLIVDVAAGRHPLPIERVTLPRAPEPPASEGSSTRKDHPGVESTGGAQRSEGKSGSGLTGTIEGFWGFDTFQGPTMPLQDSPGRDWKVLPHDPLIAGQEQQVRLASTGTACIETISLESGPGTSEKVSWKTDDKPETVDVSVKLTPAPGEDPRNFQLSIRQFGDAKADEVNLTSYSAPAKLEALSYHAGDRTAQLTGRNLEEVSALRLGTAAFVPQPGMLASAAAGQSTLELALPGGAAIPALSAGETLTAEVSLKDGRQLPLAVNIAVARPAVHLISKAAIPPAESPAGLPIRLGSPEDLPLSDTIMFSMKSARPFARNARIEVATTDGSLQTLLGLENATLILEDPHTILGKLEPLKTFGPSAFGPVQVRAIAADGTTGDWIPLTTLVRLPAISGVSCREQPGSSAQPATTHANGTAAIEEKPSVEAPPPTVDDSSSEATKPASDGTSGEAAGATGATTEKGTSVPKGTGSNESPASTIQNVPVSTCTLSGSDLFLVDSVSADPLFSNPVQVPDGFVGSTLAVPAPANGLLYLRLRDDPTTTDSISLPVAAPPDPHTGPVRTPAKR